ncbi:MAG: hypothetical protein ABR583_05480 [Gaiellaceae bacterium]
MPIVESHAAQEDRSPTVEVLFERVSRLVGQRQALRSGGAGRSALEQNRAEITRAQWQLSHALIARYSPAC